MRKKRHLFWIVSFFCLCFFVNIAFAGNYKSAQVLRQDKKSIYSYKAKTPLPPASTIKLATALYILESLPRKKINSWVRISRSAAGTEPSKAYLAAGDYYKAKDLLYAMLMASSNDAAVALAQWHSGTEKAFTQKLTKFLRKKGLKNTIVKTASGLPAEGQKSTAYDLCLLMLEASRKRDIIDALSKKTITFYSKAGKKHRLVNHNKLLWQKKYKRIIGKTGFTRRARQCFVGVVWKNKKRYAFAMLGGRTLWDNIKELVRKVYASRY